MEGIGRNGELQVFELYLSSFLEKNTILHRAKFFSSILLQSLSPISFPQQNCLIYYSKLFLTNFSPESWSLRKYHQNIIKENPKKNEVLSRNR